MKFTSIDPQFFAGIDELYKQDTSSVELIQFEVNRKQWSPKTVVIGDKLEPLALVISLQQGPANHILQLNKSLIIEDIKVSADLVQKPKSYFESGGASLVPGFTDKVEFEFSSPDHKEGLLATVRQFLQGVPGPAVAESAEAIVEEMYMNALYDAPREAQRLNFLQKSYASGGVAKFQLARSKSRLVISCADPFGSLDMTRCLSRMAEVYKKGVGDSIIFRDNGGAGIGVILMFEHAASLYFGVIPGEMTVVSAMIPLGMSNRNRALVKKSIHRIEI